MAGGWWGVPSLSAEQAEQVVALSEVDGLSLRAVADRVGTSKDSARRVLAAARNPVANLSHPAAEGLAPDGAVPGAPDRRRRAERVPPGALRRLTEAEHAAWDATGWRPSSRRMW